MQLTMFNNTERINPDRPTEPPQKFDVIYCDPPWDYDGRTFLDGKTHETGSASDHYPTMSPDELKQMNVIHLCADKCICYMWTTGPQLDISIQVLKAWGFKYKTIAFAWNKGLVNPGYYTLSCMEICIVGTRNAIPQPRGSRNELQYLSRQRERHSAKPTEFIERITRMHPEQTKLELFSRRAHQGWHCWGHDAKGKGAVAIPRLEDEDLVEEWGSDEVPSVLWALRIREGT